MICVSVSHSKQLKEAIESGAGMLELRLDLIGENPEKLFPIIPPDLPTVVTCRPGIYSEEERLSLLKKGLELGAAYVDVETESTSQFIKAIKTSAERYRKKLILSYHNFERTPGLEDLESVMIACFEKGGDVAKIATQVYGYDDLLTLLALYKIPGQKVILGMGPQGRILRVIAPYLGGEFTFASLEEGKETAPGQLSFQEMSEIFKVLDKS
jgi:3-dehydroquinate dehydratase type I